MGVVGWSAAMLLLIDTTVFRKAVQDFGRLSSPVVFMQLRLLETSGARDEWTRQKPSCHLVLRVTAYAYNEYKKYLQLVRISI